MDVRGGSGPIENRGSAGSTIPDCWCTGGSRNPPSEVKLRAREVWVPVLNSNANDSDKIYHDQTSVKRVVNIVARKSLHTISLRTEVRYGLYCAQQRFTEFQTSSSRQDSRGTMTETNRHRASKGGRLGNCDCSRRDAYASGSLTIVLTLGNISLVSLSSPHNRGVAEPKI